MTKTAKPAPVATTTVRNAATYKYEEIPITVGMGVTESCGSDAYPYEVVEIRTANKIIIRKMDSERVPGSDWLRNEWILSSNPEGRVETIRKGKDGGWKAACGTRYYVGHASRHYDPYF